MDKRIREALAVLDARTGSFATEEQKEFAADFTKPLYSFSNPGTGKSHSIIKGLIMAQTFHGVRGAKINAMSYTKDATAELKVRYLAACKKVGVAPTVKFNTFHAICRGIVTKKYPDMRIREGHDWEKDTKVLQEYMAKYGVDCSDYYYLKKVLLAIDNLNYSLIYEEENVELSYRFRELEMGIGLFQKLRSDLFFQNLIGRKISQGDIPNYTLYVLANNPQLCEQYKEQYEIMVVDEFQDMTKLYLTILSVISKNLIVIGDMKQQIYGFNGACSEIVSEYLKLYPNARRVDLTQSFRCRNEIADYATGVYFPNDVTVEAFKGVGDGGSVRVMQSRELDVPDIVSRIKVERAKKNVEEIRDTMFLFRNNFSITPIAEELFKQDVPFRVKKLYKVFDLPIFKELTELALIAEEPSNVDRVKALAHLVPEFKKYSVEECPVVLAMNSVIRAKRLKGDLSPTNIFDVEYKSRDESYSQFVQAISRANLLIRNERSCQQVFEVLFPVYDKYIISGKWWMLDKPKEYYYELIAPIVNNKTFRQMVNDEYEKERKAREAMEARFGVKCYTMHSAKGLEADDVYIVDAEDDLFPSSKNLKKLIDSNCEYEAAKVVREERNLLYVGITRAKENVSIIFRGELTALIASPVNNKFSYLDEVYKSTVRNFDDVQAFCKLLNIKCGVEDSNSVVTYKNEAAGSADEFGLDISAI